jgi:hypothetical protein
MSRHFVVGVLVGIGATWGWHQFKALPRANG